MPRIVDKISIKCSKQMFIFLHQTPTLNSYYTLYTNFTKCKKKNRPEDTVKWGGNTTWNKDKTEITI